MIELERWPDLDDPILVVAMAGWIDAGFSGGGATAFLIDHLRELDRIGRIDLADRVDLQSTRPTIELVDGIVRSIEWPAVDVVFGRAGRDVVVVHGPEPALQWPAFTADVVGMAARLGITQAAMLGGMPSPTSHRKPITVMRTASGPQAVLGGGPTRPDYQGPTGVQTVIQHTLGEAGIPSYGLWAQVPPYLAGTPCPPAIRAVLVELAALGGLDVPVDELDETCSDYLRRVEEELTERPDFAAIIDQIDRMESAGEGLMGDLDGPSTADLPTGDELASEIERYLRDQS